MKDPNRVKVSDVILLVVVLASVFALGFLFGALLFWPAP